MTSDSISALYARKDESYFGTARRDLLAMLPRSGGLRLLELGAGDGATLRAAKTEGLAEYAVGIDLVPVAPGLPEIDLFLQGNVEQMELDLPLDHFDAVLCADVLEHLIDPWRVVERLVRHLKPGGVLLASLPNIRNHRALAPILLGGDFRYEHAGLLDRSHLRFFCRKNARELFERAGLAIDDVEENMGAYGLRHRVLDFLTFHLLHDLFVFQFRIRARKP
jgi:2-polyprenyl-3-methyl-5-hydroxy-6-metoxy-1,4-benzoquinol methylase